MNPATLAKLNALAAAIRAKQLPSFPATTAGEAALPPPTPTEIETSPCEAREEEFRHIYDRYGNLIRLNDKQLEFVNLVAEGKSAVLIGAAGTGKTTCQKAATQALINAGIAGTLSSQGHKHLTSGTPGIVICAYTRRAVANIRKNVSTELQGNCITIHKLLEYQPVYYEVTDDETGKTRTTMRFEATRNAKNPLPSSIKVLIFEESSMLGTDLYNEVLAACPHGPQVIFLGDIQQLPPVFGPAILGFKLLSLPVIELTEVYRQALESPIISLAHKILSGKGLPSDKFQETNKPPLLKLHPWKKKIAPEDALNTVVAFFREADKHGAYDVEEDMILIPYNKQFGTDELNLKLANHFARKHSKTTHQVIAGFNRRYFSEGEKILYDKEDAVIIKIEPNPAYYGVPPLPASATLDYFGYDPASQDSKSNSTDDVDFLLGQVALQQGKDEERTKQSSHLITIRRLESDQELTLSAAGEINAILYGYALTVHKAQGSEWRRVFLLLHHSHNRMIQRELLYTAVTRAKEELYVICEPDSFVRGIENARIKGTTLAEKAIYFKGKLNEQQDPELM